MKGSAIICCSGPVVYLAGVLGGCDPARQTEGGSSTPASDAVVTVGGEPADPPYVPPPEPDFKEPVDYLGWFGDLIQADGFKLVPVAGLVNACQQVPPRPRALSDVVDRMLENPGPWIGAEHPEVSAWMDRVLAAEDTCLDEMVHFAVIAAPDRTLVDVLLPGTEPLRSLSRAHLLVAWRDPGRAPNELASHLRAAIAVANRVPRNLFITYRVGLETRRLVLQSMIGGMQRGSITPGEVRRLLGEMECEDWNAILRRWLFFEHAMHLSLLQELCQPLRWPGPRFHRRKFEKLTEELVTNGDDRPLKDRRNPDPRAAVASFREYYASIAAGLDRPYSAATLTRVADADARLVEVNDLAAFMPPRTQSHLQKTLELEAASRAYRLLVTLLLTRRETGRWPPTLDTVAPEADRCRIDPYTGREFVYELLGDSVAITAAGPDGRIGNEYGHDDMLFGPITPQAKASDQDDSGPGR